MRVYGEAKVAKFATRHASSRKPLQRFLAIVQEGVWPHFSALRETFASADVVGGRLVFDIGGNKYRLIASIDFEEQMLVVGEVLTHEEYDRKVL